MPGAAQVRTFDVPAQAAITAIPELARQGDVQILVSERAARGRMTRGVRGSMDVAEALEILLRGTGLRVENSNGRTFTLAPALSAPMRGRPAQPPTVASTEAASAEEPLRIVVTGFRSSLSSALARKQRETGAVDTILAEDIGKFPDSNLAESMQRLPGISLTRGDGGEGRNITVRGLAAEFTRVRINGMDVVSQTGSSDVYGGSNDSRRFDFNVFPSEMFSELTVRKTGSAEINEGSLGATIDLNTPRPLDLRQDLVLTAAARGVYNGAARELDPRVSALFSVKSSDGRLGALVSGSYGRRHTRDVGYSAVLVLPAWVNGGFCSPVGVTPITPDPTQYAHVGTDGTHCSTGNPRTGSLDAWNAIQGRRGPRGQPGGGAFFPRLPRYLDSQQEAERYGATLGLQWAPDADTTVTFDALYAGFSVDRADSYISGLSFARSASSNGEPMTSVREIEIDPLGSVIYGLYDGVDVRSERWVDQFSTHLAQGTLRFDRRIAPDLRVSGIAGAARTAFVSPHRMWLNMDANDTTGFAVDFRQDSTFPAISFGVDVADPGSFAFGPALPDGTVQGTLGDRKLDRTTLNTTFGADAEWTAARWLTLTFGVQRRVSDYRSTTMNLDPARQAPPALPAGTSLADVTLQVTGLDRLLGGGAPARWAAMDHARWMELVDYNDSWFCGVECGAGKSRVLEAISATYAMARFATDRLPFRLRGDIGVRYAHTDQFSVGHVPVAAAPGALYPAVGERVAVRRDYGDWLPSMNLVAEIGPQLILRLGTARVISRPDLAPLIPSGTIDAVGRRGSISNPLLDPIRATTFDAAAEWYFAPGSLLSTAYFRKEIGTFVQSVNALIPFNELGLPAALLANSQTRPDELFIINRLANTPGGTLEGLEISLQAPFTSLPGLLGRFGVLSSLTLVRSRIDYILQSASSAPTLTTTHDLVGLSRRAISGTAYYEDSRFSARITGNYRSRFIRTIPSGAFDSDLIGNRPTFIVDMAASLRIGPRAKLLLEAQNLTNEANVQYIDSARQDSLFALRTGRTFTVGIAVAR
jgi:TonB-dependent receptor